MSVRPSRTSVRAYVRRSTKSFFDFNEIWNVGKGRWVMHDGMQYDPIQGQVQGHEPLKFGNSSILKAIPSSIYKKSHLKARSRNKFPITLKVTQGHRNCFYSIGHISLSISSL